MSTKIQPAIKQEAKHIAVYCLIGTALMWLVFFIWHQFITEKVPFDYTVILGGLGGSFVAVLNFMLMGMTVQKVVLITDAATAKKVLKFSYTRRFFLQIAWCVIAILVPCFHMIAGLIPLLFPSLGIKARAIFFRNSFKNDPVTEIVKNSPLAEAEGISEQKSAKTVPDSETIVNDAPASAEAASAPTNSDNNDDDHLSFREV